MWAIGSFGVIAYCLYDMIESIPGRIIGALIAIPIWVFFGLTPMALIHHEEGPQLATLLKSDWHCASSHQETNTTYVQSGKVMVPITSTTDVCDVYGRN